MKNEKLYEYAISNHLGFNFIKRILINEQTKIVWFELIAIYIPINIEVLLIRDTNDLSSERVNWKIKDFLLGIIETEITDLICELNLDYKIEGIFEQLENGFIVNGKEFLLECDKYAELREKVLNEVKLYGLH